MKRPVCGSRITVALSGALFIASAICAVTLSEIFIFLAAIAAFLPDLLRLVGLLTDTDEFQHAASGRASRVAIAVGSAYLALLYWLSRRGFVETASQPDAWLVGLTLVIAVRFIAYEMMFWDARAGAPRVLVAFGAFWTVFVVASEWGHAVALVIEAAVVVLPFIAGALAVSRFPKVVGILSLAGAIAAFLFFHLYRVFLGDLGSLVVLALIPAPLTVVGIGLLASKREVDDEANR